MINIALDGPSGAGKSTVAKQLAAKLNFIYLDTGAMYRAIALKLHELNISLSDLKGVEEVLKTTEIEIKYENGAQRIFTNGDDVSTKIREHFVSKLASDASALKCVRLKMVELQREIAAKQNMILDGRDIGSFVLPNAKFKFYITASVEERAKRRFLELTAKGEKHEFDEIKKDIETRDFNDMNRDFAPLVKAKDAIEIDTTGLSIDEVVNHIIGVVKKGK